MYVRKQYRGDVSSPKWQEIQNGVQMQGEVGRYRFLAKTIGDAPALHDSMDAKKYSPRFHMGTPHMEMGGQAKKSHLGTPHFHTVFVIIWGLTLYKVFEHINMLSVGIQKQPYMIIGRVDSDLGLLGCLWSGK